jgi:hypothetical protein
MPFQKGRAKTGGRKASGVPLVQLRREVAEKLQELGFDPIVHLVELATEKGCHPDRKARICSELAKYVWPQRKAVEHTGAGGGPIELSDVSARELLLSRIDRLSTRSGSPEGARPTGS